MKLYHLAVAGLLAGCANYVPADPANPPTASAWSDSHACQRSDQNYASGVAAGLTSPASGLLFGLADLPGYENRLDACMKERGWVRAAN